MKCGRNPGTPYERFKSDRTLTRPEKVDPVGDHVEYYERHLAEDGLTGLNTKIPDGCSTMCSTKWACCQAAHGTTATTQQ